MSNKKRNNFKYSKNLKIDDYTTQKHMLVTAVFVAIACVFIGIGIIEYASVDKVSIKPIDSNNEDELIKSFKDTESLQVGIDFYKIDTTDEEYELLREECNKYMEEDLEDNKTDLDINIKITDETYVDNSSIDRNNNKDTEGYNTVMHETGPLYFQDKILLRYVNEIGEMQVIASGYENINISDKIITIGKNELYKIFSNNTLGSTEINTETTSSNIITEKQYISDITNIFVEGLTSDLSVSDSKFKKQALKYFTYDGYNNILDGKKRLSLSANTNIEVVVAEAGKSNNKLKDKDRIFIQLKITDNNTVILTSIVVKLDKNFKVFDIDIL